MHVKGADDTTWETGSILLASSYAIILNEKTRAATPWRPGCGEQDEGEEEVRSSKALGGREQGKDKGKAKGKTAKTTTETTAEE